MASTNKLYEQDYSAWAKRQIELLSKGRFAELAIDHLVEELEDMGRSERNELESRLTILPGPGVKSSALPGVPPACA